MCSYEGDSCSKFHPISPFDCKLTEVFAYFWLTASNFKIPEQFPLNYLLIGQIGSNLLQDPRICVALVQPMQLTSRPRHCLGEALRGCHDDQTDWNDDGGQMADALN